MRRLLVIGIGMGDPAQLTVQAIAALNEVDVFFLVDKGDVAKELRERRELICAEYIRTSDFRVVEIPDPPRARSAPDYPEAVRDWHARRVDAFEGAIELELGPDGTGGLLVWGDPALYDSTLRVIDGVLERGRVSFEHRVIPGISSVQQLAAAHRIVLHGIGSPVLITTGRRLAEAVRSGVRDIVVMLDGDLACRDLTAPMPEIYWGAYLGSPDETLIAGPLTDVVDEIVETRAALRARKGWIMDVYLLRWR